MERYMAKGKTMSMFYCQNCGHESRRWLGQCPGCREWNTFVEETVIKGKSAQRGLEETKSPLSLSSIAMDEDERIETSFHEFDRVLGGGLVPGSFLLVGGDPGIGKSTLLLQICRELSLKQQKVLYISGEESLKQIKMRANRIGPFTEDFWLLCETNIDLVEEAIRKTKPHVVVIDSIQTMFHEEISSAPGSVSQVREATSAFLKIAKGMGITIFIVGHVTKEGTMAGPRVLEHMVDTVLYFEGEHQAPYRILRGVKNRFGSTNEIGVFEMRDNGLKEVKNPSEYMLNGKPKGASGSVVSCSIEGTRPVLVEIQALVCQSYFQLPRRQAAGTDFNRLNLLIAVLEKRLGLQIAGCDAYVNVAGGIRIVEPAIDLAICMAIVSSHKNRSIDEGSIAFGEVGLSGEVRGVNMAKSRVMEAKKLGFKTCILPEGALSQAREIEGIHLIGVKSVKDAMDII